jgi:hypothetical protein
MDTIRIACRLVPVGGQVAMTLRGWSELVIPVSVIRRRHVRHCSEAGKTSGATRKDRNSGNLGVSHSHA